MKKLLLSVLALTLVFMMSFSVQAEEIIKTCVATADFYDMVPNLVHDSPRVDAVISCNMVVKPKTQVHLSRLCSSAVSNVKYYFNDSTSDIQEGPDHSNTVEDEIFYPASMIINDSYLGGTISYKVSTEFQTKKTSGEKIYLEVPVDDYQPAVIISSKTLYLDMGEAYTLSQPTGDQSIPNWLGTKKAYPNLLGIYVNWTFRFGSRDNPSGAFGLLKATTKRVSVVSAVNYTAPDLADYINEENAEDFGCTYVDGVIYLNTVKSQPLSDEDGVLCKKAKKLVMQYNLNENACDSLGHTLTEEGWKNIDEGQAASYLKIVEDSEGNVILQYPDFANAWGRVFAILETPTAEDCKPVRRTIVKSRIGSSYPGFEFRNMKEGDVLKIYNVNGKKIREITSGTPEGFVWDGRNDSGDWAKSGIYVYQLKVDGKLVSGTIVFVY